MYQIHETMCLTLANLFGTLNFSVCANTLVTGIEELVGVVVRFTFVFTHCKT